MPDGPLVLYALVFVLSLPVPDVQADSDLLRFADVPDFHGYPDCHRFFLNVERMQGFSS